MDIWDNDDHDIVDRLAQRFGDGRCQLGRELVSVERRLGHVCLDAKARHDAGFQRKVKTPQQNSSK
jgi:hypothetical protein